MELNSSSVSLSLKHCQSDLHSLGTDVPSASASVIELQVTPRTSEGVDNLAYSNEHDENKENINNSQTTAFQRNNTDRMSKKSLEVPFSAEVFKTPVESKTCVEKIENVSSKEFPSFDEKLRSAFEKSVECVKVRRGNYFNTKNRVAASQSCGTGVATDGDIEEGFRDQGQDKGTNTEPLEVIVHPRAELQKSYSLGCLIYHLNASSASSSNTGGTSSETPGMMTAHNPTSDSMTPVSCLPRSESLDTCLQGDSGTVYRYSALPAGIIDWSNITSYNNPQVPSQQQVIHFAKKSSRSSMASTAVVVPSSVSMMPGENTVLDLPEVSDVVVETIPPKRKVPVRAQSTLSSCSSNRSDGRVCRICWFSEDNEPVIQPCTCSGSTAFVHSSCLQKWLSVTNNFKCEICLFKFKTKRKIKPLKQPERGFEQKPCCLTSKKGVAPCTYKYCKDIFLSSLTCSALNKWRWKLEKSRPRSQLEATLILLAIVTPPLICGIILCSQKIVEFLNNPDHSWSGTGMPLALMTLVLASTLTYLVAVVYFLRKLGSVCCLWVKSNETTIVQLGDNEHMIEHGKENQSVWAIT